MKYYRLDKQHIMYYVHNDDNAWTVYIVHVTHRDESLALQDKPPFLQWRPVSFFIQLIPTDEVKFKRKKNASLVNIPTDLP